MKTTHLVVAAAAAGVLAAVGVGVAANATSDSDPLYVSLKGISDYQVAVLEAGLTEDTYAEALTAAVECVRAEGIAVTDPLPVDDYGTLSYLFSGEGEVTDNEVTAVADRCQTEYHSQIDAQWSEALANGTGPHAQLRGGEVSDMSVTFPSEYELKK